MRPPSNRPAPNRPAHAGPPARRGPAGAGAAVSPGPVFRESPANSDDGPIYPSLKRKTPKERADSIVADLKEAILNPGRLDGSTGMAYGDWQKIARNKITRAIAEAEASAMFRELMSANRIGGLCMRVGFLLLAALASFGGFWFGTVFIWDTYGPAWGTGAMASAIGLALAFVVAGVMLSGKDVEIIRKDVRQKLKLDD
ncbi:hypothetical protein [Thalassobaculum salexigens]|uniref:hypothetical protein n=1 Tax=Thalassobaculum salexigens TaxID=455360 RepID=UPI00248EEFDC|nr:hypothetical protein [Thalassobaculum salexigens]